MWLKATPHFAADEAAALTAIARHDRTLVPEVIDGGPGRLLLEHVPGGHNRDAPDDVIASVLGRFATVQAALAFPGRRTVQRCSTTACPTAATPPPRSAPCSTTACPS